jgi:acyl carrier protein
MPVPNFSNQTEPEMTAMDDGKILEAITEVVRDVFDDPTMTVTPDLSRQTEARWDSMNHLNLFFALEARFGIKFGVAEVEEVQRVSDLMRLVRDKTQKL